MTIDDTHAVFEGCWELSPGLCLHPSHVVIEHRDGIACWEVYYIINRCLSSEHGLANALPRVVDNMKARTEMHGRVRSAGRVANHVDDGATSPVRGTEADHDIHLPSRSLHRLTSL